MSIPVMGIAALVAWVVTALGGFIMLGQWIRRGGLRQQRSGATRFPSGLMVTHFGLAAGGLVVWIAYLLTNTERLAWVAFVLLIPVALLGFAMLTRWIPVYRGHAIAAGTPQGRAPPAPDRWKRNRPSSTCLSPSLSRTVCSPWSPSCWCCLPPSGER